MGLFVRKVWTASGATAVQIAHTRGGVQTILEHLGSAHDNASLAALVQVAKSKIQGGQQFFDLDALTPTSPVTASPTVVGSSSRVLWEVLQGAYDRLGFDTVGDETFKKLCWRGWWSRPRSRTRSVSWACWAFRRRRCGRSGGPWPGVSSGTGVTV